MNWQALIVGTIVLGAALFLGRRVLGKLQAFFGSKPVESSCGSCGGCSVSKTATETAPTVVQIQQMSSGVSTTTR